MTSNNSTLKIGFDAKRLFNNFTGLGNYSRTLVSNLQKHFPQHEYHLFTPDVTINEQTAPFLTTPFILHQPQNPLNKVLWRTAQQSKQINNLELDIYHGLSHELPYGIGPKTKTCVTFHDLIFERLPKHFGFWDRKLYQFKYKSATHQANKIIAISQRTKEDLKQIYKVAPNKIDVIYQSLANAFLNNPIDDQSEEFFLYVGSIIERKGLLNIIEAMALAPVNRRKPICVIGDGGAYKDKCLKAIAHHKLEAYFDFKGSVSNEQLFGYYDRCIALILPSQYEGFGIPIIEALTRLKPVITTKDSAMAEACGPGGILIDPNYPDQLVEAMSTIQKPDVRQELIDKGNQHVKDHFDGVTLSYQLIKFYEGLLT